MKTQRPRVTVGIPVYNGDDFVDQAISAVLCQTFTDFELIISDNASTDGTEGICRELAKRDPRIRYVRNADNIGLARNCTQLVSLARGEYFKWLAHDDLCAPETLERSVDVLDRDPTVVVCYSWTQTVDVHGQVLSVHQSRLSTDSDDPRVRFFDIVTSSVECFEQFGLIRTAAFRDSPLGAYPGSDQVLLAALALAGRFHQVPESLSSVRDHPRRYTRAALTGNVPLELSSESLRRRNSFYNPAGGGVTFVQWKVLSEMAKAVLHSNLAPGKKAGCWFDLVRRSWWHRSVLARDVAAGALALRARFVGSLRKGHQSSSA